MANSGSGTYWLAEPGGQPQGPYDVAALRQFQAQGRITGSSQVCAEGSTTWMPAASLLGASPPPPAYAPPGHTAPGAAAWQPASYLAPVLVTVFCCLIGGIVSIVYTANANTKAAGGDFAGAERDKSTARTWMIVSLVIGFVVSGGWMLIVLLGGLAGGGRGNFGGP